MTDHTNVEFLQQAYQAITGSNIWPSLNRTPKWAGMLAFLTASVKRQANMYRGQLDWRRMTGPSCP